MSRIGVAMKLLTATNTPAKDQALSKIFRRVAKS